MRSPATRIAPLLLFALVAACGDDDPAGPDPALTVALTPTTAQVTQGATTVINVTVTGPTGFTGDVTITVSQLPTGVTAPLSDVQKTGNVTTAKVTLTAAVDAAVGTSNVKVTATATGVTSDNADVALTVAAPATP